MCEAGVYILKNGMEQLVMESVDIVEPLDQNAWHMVNIFGEQKTISGRIISMRLVDHKILFEETAGAHSHEHRHINKHEHTHEHPHDHGQDGGNDAHEATGHRSPHKHQHPEHHKAITDHSKK